MARSITHKLREAPSWEIARAHLEKWIIEKEADLGSLIDAMDHARTPDQLRYYARKIHAARTKQFESLRHIFDYLCASDDPDATPENEQN